MRSQCEKMKEMLRDKIEEYSEKPFSDTVAEHLSVYCGALKALYALDKKESYESDKSALAPSQKARTAELDGDTEFEKVIMSIPSDYPHMVAITSILADHMESLAVINRRAYDNIMMRLREVAKH